MFRIISYLSDVEKESTASSVFRILRNLTYTPLTYHSKISLSITPYIDMQIPHPSHLSVSKTFVKLFINSQEIDHVFATNIDFCRQNSRVEYQGNFLTYFIEAQLHDLKGPSGFRGKYLIEHIPLRSELGHGLNKSSTPLVSFSRHWARFSPNYSDVETQIFLRKSISARKHLIKVCLYFSDRMDGMKSKLLSIIEALPIEEFSFTFFACKADDILSTYESPLYSALRKMNR